MIYLNEEKSRNLLHVADKKFEISRGKPLPLGASVRRGGVNFAVYSKHARSVTLVLFMPGDNNPIAEFPFNPRFNRTGDIWHAFISGLEHGVEYGYRVEQQDNSIPKIHQLDSARILIDPYARALSGGEVWGRIGNHRHLGFPTRWWRSIIYEDTFDWGEDQPLNTPLSETVIYELHVRGYTRHRSSQVRNPGTYLGMIEKIPYLKELGITAVELLPINEFSEIDTSRTDPETGQPLLNYWGYNSINFFAPKASYASNNRAGNQVQEFKKMVKAFHEAGLEIILDMVFNHTAEGDYRGPTLSFRGLDNSTYYLLSPKTGEYLNYSGCGNTMNCNHPVVREMILDCLRYWVMEMHVDGFRFDLASILSRGQDGAALANPPLLERIAVDPILSKTKLIAEAWDAAGLYQVGTFPAYGRWAEWNGKFRDDIRRFVKSDEGQTEVLANRLIGSPDIYEGSGRIAHHSINFITCHDGFTLADLVSYTNKHNEANGEDNLDGTNDNFSWNCGKEGPVGESDRDIILLRRRRQRNMAILLLVSEGVPMILAGDEFGRTQLGNNNAYCQDNEISWIDWTLVEKNSDLLRFFKQLIKFRKQYPLRTNSASVIKDGKSEKIIWHGVNPGKPDWSHESRCLAMQVSIQNYKQSYLQTELYFAFNAYWKPVKFNLPELKGNRNWYQKIDTSLASPDDILESGRETKLEGQSFYYVGPRSIIALLGR